MKSPLKSRSGICSGGIANEVGHRRLGYVQPGRRDQREALQPLGVEDREVGCDPAAEREADEVDAVELEHVEEVAVVEHEVVEAVEPLRELGVAEARMLGSDQVDRLATARS